MAILNKPDLLDAPIPGQSLTEESGSYPWEQPPKLTTVDEAVEHYVPMLQDEEILSDALSNIESGVALTTMADVITIEAALRETMGDSEEEYSPVPEELQLTAEEPEEASMGMMTRRGV